MFTSGSRYYFGLALFAFVAAVLYGAASGDHTGIMSMIVGPLTLGYKGSVGDHVGYSVLMGLSIVAFFIGCVVIAFRDADAAAVSQVARTEVVPEALPPSSPSYVPIFAAFGAGILLLGVVVGPALFVLGTVVLVMVLVEWAVKLWSDRATGDPAVNQRIRNRIMNPLEIPIIGFVVVAIFVLGISRVLLALPKVGADVIFAAVPILIFVAGVVVANRKKMSKNVVVGLLVVGGLAVLVGGVVAAAAGEREFEKHHPSSQHGAVAPIDRPSGIVVRVDR